MEVEAVSPLFGSSNPQSTTHAETGSVAALMDVCLGVWVGVRVLADCPLASAPRWPIISPVSESARTPAASDKAAYVHSAGIKLRSTRPEPADASYCLLLKRLEPAMSDAKPLSYATHLDIKYAPLERIDVPSLVASCTDAWYNQTLCRVNNSVVRLGVMQGEYHWHKHDDDDELFFVLDGEFIVDHEGRSVELEPLQGFLVPKRVAHRTRAPKRAVILMVETAAIIPTGD